MELLTLTMYVTRSFFSSNDHYYYNGILRDFEDKYAPFKWASNVIYCDGTGSKTTCRVVTSEPLQYANGVLLVDDGKTLLVNDLYEGTTNIYEVDPSTKDLILERKVVSRLRADPVIHKEDPSTPANINIQRLGGTPDNLAQIPTNGDIVVPGKLQT